MDVVLPSNGSTGSSSAALSNDRCLCKLEGLRHYWPVIISLVVVAPIITIIAILLIMFENDIVVNSTRIWVDVVLTDQRKIARIWPPLP